MSRQNMSPKNVNKYRKKLNLPIAYIWVRGGTDHTKMLLLEDGTCRNLYSDGTMDSDAIDWKAEREKLFTSDHIPTIDETITSRMQTKQKG